MIMLGISAARGPWITFEKADSGICEVKKNFFVKFWGSQSYTWIFNCAGLEVGTTNPTIAQESLYIIENSKLICFISFISLILGK